MRGSRKGLAVVLAAAVFAAIPAAAQGYGQHGQDGKGGSGGSGVVAHLTKELGLTGDQQTTLQAIVSKYMDGALGETMHAMHDARGTLGETIHNPDATDQQVQDAAAAVSTIEAKLAAEQHHMAVEIGAVLTADQRAKLAQLKPTRRDRGEGPPPPPPPDGGF